MSSHALAAFERRLRIAAQPRPPSLRGSKMNQARRDAFVRWWYDNARRRLNALPPQAADRAALGSFHPWITAARAEAANVARVAKAQAALRHRSRSRA